MASEEELEYLKQLSSQSPNAAEESLTSQEITLINTIVTNFMTVNGLLAYGGHAINAILPKEDRFYVEGEMNDYDMLSPHAKEHAKALADILYSHGFQLTEVVPALHDGTYKVRVNFQHIADVTEVSVNFFNAMFKLSQNERKHHKYIDKTVTTFNIAPIYLLKHFIIKEMALPKTALFRWPKVYSRLALVYKHYNPSTKFGSATKDTSSTLLSTPSTYSKLPDVVPIYQNMIELFKKHKIPLIGNFAIGLHLGKNFIDESQYVVECCKIDEFFSIFEVLSEDPLETFELLKSALSPLPESCKLETKQRFYYGDIMPNRLRVFLDVTVPGSKTPVRISLATIVSIKDYCYSTCEVHGLTTGTPYTILSFLYAYYLIYKVFEGKKIANKVNMMIHALEEYVETLDMSKRYITTCFGKAKSMFEVKKEIFMDPSKKYLYRPYDSLV